MVGVISVEVIYSVEKIKVGTIGENIAADYLKLRGYEILERNYRVKHFEIDLIARDENCLVFIEVKTRGNSAFGSAVESLTSWKISNIRKAARHYIIHEEKFSSFYEIRLDFIAIDIEVVYDKMVLRHLKGVA